MPTYYSTLSNASYRLRLDVSLSSQDTVGNTSTISWAYYIERLSGTGRFSSYTTSGSATFGGGATGDSATGVSRASYDFRSGVVTLLWGSGSRVITHNTDGTATLRSSASFTGDGNIGTGSIGTQNWALPTIPRAATSITRNSGTETGSATVLGLSPLVSSFYYVLKYQSPATGTWTTIGPAGGIVGSSWPYSTTVAHSQIPNAESGTISFQVTTLSSSGGTQIGTPVEAGFVYTVPSAIVPSVGVPTWTEGATTTGLSTLTNAGAVFAQNWSRLRPTFSSSAGTGATVTSATASVNGVTGTTTSTVAFANVVTTQGVSATFSTNVTDSRGRTAAQTGTVSPSVHRWSLPTANVGTPVITPTSTTQTIALSGLQATSTSFYVSGAQRNVLQTRLGYRNITTSGPWVYGSWTSQALSSVDATDNAYAPGTAQTVATGLDPTNQYEVTLQVRDIFGLNSVNYSTGLSYVASSLIVPAQNVLMAFSNNTRVGIKKIPTLGDLDILGQAYQNDGERIVSVLPGEVANGEVPVWNSSLSRWVSSPQGGATSSSSPPASPAPNQLWLDNDTGTLYVWYVDSTGGQWVEVGRGVGGAVVDRLAALEQWTGSALPAFHARLSADQTKSGTNSWVKIAFNSALVNRGGHYSTANQQFTAPVNGVYEFSLALTTSTANGGPLAMISHNVVPSAASGFEMGGYNVSYGASGFTKIVQMNAGEWVAAYLFNGNSLTVTLTAGYGNHFSGKLLTAL